MIQLILLLILIISLSIILTPFLALSEIEGEIDVTPPPNWKPSNSINNSASMMWFQNSTKSVFAILKAPNNLVHPLFFAGPLLTGYFKYKGILESADQFNFGHNNHGYRYFLNLSSPSNLLNSFSGLIPINDFLQEIPKGYDIPYEGMLILTEKHGVLYAIILLSPIDSFKSILNEINPTLGSIQLTKYNKIQN